MLDELAAEEHDIVTRLGRDLRPGGRSRSLGDVREQARNRVCNAIRRALREIYDPPLADHLKRPVLSRCQRTGSDASMRYQNWPL